MVHCSCAVGLSLPAIIVWVVCRLWGNFAIWNEISCTKLQLPPEPLTRRLPPPDLRFLSVLCPQLNLLNPPPRTKFLGTPLLLVTLHIEQHTFYCDVLHCPSLYANIPFHFTFLWSNHQFMVLCSGRYQFFWSRSNCGGLGVASWDDGFGRTCRCASEGHTSCRRQRNLQGLVQVKGKENKNPRLSNVRGLRTRGPWLLLGG